MGTFLFLIAFLGFFYALVMLILGIFIRGKKLFRPKLNLIILGGTFVLAIIGATMAPTTQTAAEPKVETKSEEVQKDKLAKEQEEAKQKLEKEQAELKKEQEKLAKTQAEQLKKEQAQLAKDKALAEQKAKDLKIQQEQQAKLEAEQKAAQIAEKEKAAEEAQKAKEKEEQRQQALKDQQEREKQEAQAKQASPPASNDGGSGNQYVDSNGQGTIKGSVNGIYHLPGGTYYNRTKNVVAWFKTTAEAEAAGYRPSER
ncbi:sunset domain-containing protein [Paenilisteria newyorkensis]|uniref:sunset domain-containing protein n=1 Tax=Listeria newyorkensis TaxID=1497681 RepID=UPI000669B699|nr:hypothetical protein [Listeria newyorkensis]KMT61254.1 hypothetical protein X559_2220 [Listeria newyorkensis]